MNAITSIYIPCIDSNFTAEFIAHVLDRNEIAEVSRVLIEPYKSNIKNGLRYNRAYIGIKSWHETEAAYNFIERLRNPSREARIVYYEDNWWPVDINKYHSKLASNKRVLTVFGEKQTDFFQDQLSTTAVVNDELDTTAADNDELDTTAAVNDQLGEFIKVDVEKTKLLRNIIANFKKKDVPAFDSDVPAFDSYVVEMYERYMLF